MLQSLTEKASDRGTAALGWRLRCLSGLRSPLQDGEERRRKLAIDRKIMVVLVAPDGGRRLVARASVDRSRSIPLLLQQALDGDDLIEG